VLSAGCSNGCTLLSYHANKFIHVTSVLYDIIGTGEHSGPYGSNKHRESGIA
jgi:hypothetical protein